MRKKLFSILLTLFVGMTATVSAQQTVTVGSKVTDASSLVSGTPYLIKYSSMTGTPYITEDVDSNIGAFYSAPNSQNTPTAASVFYFISDGENWKIENAYTGNYWPTPSANATLVPTTAANAGSWAISISSGTATLTCNNYGLDRLSNPQRVVSWSSRKTVEIYEVSDVSLSSTTPFSEFANKDIKISSTAASSIATGTWYVMFDRGAYHGYLYENVSSHTLYNITAAPSGSAVGNANYLVRLLNGSDGKYYLQTGLGNYFGLITESTAVPTTALIQEQITVEKIASTDGHFYLQASNNEILDANTTYYGPATVVGWGTTVPTSTGGNNDWAFYPVEFEDSWIPTASEVYTINNTNSNRGAMMYAPSQSTTYVWSSGKNSQTFDATSANCQWVLYPTGTIDQYYLYNVGAGKFAIPATGGTYSGYNWIFSPSAVAVTFISQSDGTYKIKTANSDTYAAVSNNYTGPIINYNDVGGNFTITKVDGDASTAVTAAVNKLAINQTALTATPSGDGWYAIRVKTHGTYPDYFLFPKETTYNGTQYSVGFYDQMKTRPSISDATYYFHITKSGTSYYWQMPDGRYLYGANSKFPVSTFDQQTSSIDYVSGSGFRFSGSSRYAVPYLLGGVYFIGETASSGNAYYDIYPVNLTTVGLQPWQVLCDNAPDTQEITCSRSDVNGLASVYKNGYIFLPSNVTPTNSDFSLPGATSVTVNASAHTVTFEYDPNLAIVEAGVTVAQGWQTAGRSSDVYLLRVTAAPFKAATGVSLNIGLKDGTENEISALTLYEASSSSPEILGTGSGALTMTSVATVNTPSATTSLAIGSLAAGTHYYWIAATVKSTATLGAVLDAKVTGITYTCNNTETTLDLTSTGDPADRGAMVFNTRSYLFTPWDDGSRSYRIPAMVVADDGSIVVAADKRYGSTGDLGNHKIDVVVRRSTDGGVTWSSPVTVATGDGSSEAAYGYGDPSFVKCASGKLICLFAAGSKAFGSGLNHIGMVTSTNNGQTWSSVVDITTKTDHFTNNSGQTDFFVTSGKGLCTHDGVVMFLIDANRSSETNYVLYSVDEGENWIIDDAVVATGANEAKLVELADGNLLSSTRNGYSRIFNTGTYTKNTSDCDFTWGTQWSNSQLYASGYGNNQDIIYYQREAVTGKTDVIFHSMTTGQHANLKLYYSTDQGANWTEFLNVQTKGARYAVMGRGGSEDAPESLYLFFEDQSLNSAGGNADYNHYPLNFLEITRDQLVSLIPGLDKIGYKEVKIVKGTIGETTYGAWDGSKVTWTSNATSGLAGVTLTKSGGTFDKYTSYNSRYNLAYKVATAGTAETFTLTAPTGYIITGYTLDAMNHDSGTGSFVAADGTTASTSTAGYATLSVDGLNATSTTITVNASTTGWLAISNFVVQLAIATDVEGDIDGDKDCDEYDLVALVGYLVGQVDANDIDIDAADVNGDGHIGIGDVTALINKLKQQNP